MSRRENMLVTSILLLLFASNAAAQERAAQLRVLVPQDDAKLFIDDKLTAQKGDERLFLSPALEPGYTYRYTVTAKWWPNNYTEVIRTRSIDVKAGQTLTVDLRQQDPKKPDNYHIRFVPTPEDVVEHLAPIVELGYHHLIAGFPAPYDEESMTRLATEVRPRLEEMIRA